MEPRADPTVRRRVRINPTLIALLVLVALHRHGCYLRGHPRHRSGQAQGRPAHAGEGIRSQQALFVHAHLRPHQTLAFQHAASFAAAIRTRSTRSQGPRRCGWKIRSWKARTRTAARSIAPDLCPSIFLRELRSRAGQRTLMSDVDYTIQPSATSPASTVLLRNADAIITPLDTPRVRKSRPTPRVRTTIRPRLTSQTISRRSSTINLKSASASEMPSQQALATARPSFDCANAQSRGEMAVCSDAGLAALDRSMTAQYRRALALAPPDVQDQLRQTGERFIAYPRPTAPQSVCWRRLRRADAGNPRDHAGPLATAALNRRIGGREVPLSACPRVLRGHIIRW